MTNKRCLIYETLGKVSDLKITESEGDGLMRLEGVFGVCGIKNQNNRIYDKANYKQMVEALQQVIATEGCPGELEHPNSMNITLENISHKIESIQMNEDGTITGTIALLNTPKGKIAQAIVEGGLPLYISSRGAGTITNEGRVTLSTIKTYDLVGTPGFSQAKLNLKENQTLECLNESFDDGNITYAIVENDDEENQDFDDAKDSKKKGKAAKDEHGDGKENIKSKAKDVENNISDVDKSEDDLNKPEDEPTDEPEDEPADKPEDEPTDEPEDEPTDKPEDEPTDEPEDKPTDEPEDKPTDEPEDKPTDEPKDKPTDEPEDKPTDKPEDEPTDEPEENSDKADKDLKKSAKKAKKKNDNIEDNTEYNKNNDNIDMKDLKDAIMELSDKVTSLEAELHIAKESLEQVKSESKSINYDAVQTWITEEFAPEFKSDIVESLNDNHDVNKQIDEAITKAIKNVKDWAINDFATEVQNWVSEEFAPEVQNWITEEFAPEVQNWVSEEFAPEVQNWITEEFAPLVDSWITEEYGPALENKVNENVSGYLAENNAGRLDEIDSLLETIDANKTPLENIVKEASMDSNYKNVYVVENMPAQYKPAWQMLSEEKQQEIVRSSRMYDFTKAGVLESFWAGVDFNEKTDDEKPVNENSNPIDKYHNTVFTQMMRLRNPKG